MNEKEIIKLGAGVNLYIKELTPDEQTAFLFCVIVDGNPKNLDSDLFEKVSGLYTLGTKEKPEMHLEVKSWVMFYLGRTITPIDLKVKNARE